MSRVIAVTACGLMLAACSAAMPSLDFLKSAPQSETLAIESEPPGAEAKTSLGQSCRTPCQLAVQPGSEFFRDACAERLSAADRVGASGGGGCYAPAGTQSGSGHPAGGEAGKEAACSEKDAGCSSDPSRGAAAHGLGRPDERAGSGSGPCARAFGCGRVGSVRDRISLAIALVPLPIRLRAAPAPTPPERWTLWPISVRIPI
jgi:hypothetical protein